MNTLEKITMPSKADRLLAMESFEKLESTLSRLQANPEIEIEETKDKIKIPIAALELLAEVLKAMSKGQPFSLVPIHAEMTTQAAAEFLSCSRPHVVKLLETGEIPFTKVGRHRRIKFQDLVDFKQNKKKEREKLLIEMMAKDEESGLYDSQH